MRKDNIEVLTPEPPAPEARFTVSSEKAAIAAARLHEISSDPSLNEAVLLAHLGFVDDARTILDRLIVAHVADENRIRALRDSLNP
jgi:hypothetical protein